MIIEYPIKAARKYFTKVGPRQKTVQFHGYVDCFDSDANDLVRDELLKDKPSMIAKFGTTEFICMRNYMSIKEPKRISDVIKYIKRQKSFLWWWETHQSMADLSGLFPATPKMAERFCELMIEDIKYVDILGSYLKDEIIFQKELANAKRINLDGYYAPFRFDNPWTEVLEGKKVLVVHPFEESIRSQYEKRALLFENPKVLPEFELHTIKAVQTVGSTDAPEFNDWFDALNSMKAKIDATDFDIALIGCGAYGFPLAAHVKRMGKKAVHLAGWTQMLFGIYGKRWEKDAENSKYINEHWARPLPSEVPASFKKVEWGAYW